MTCKDCIHNMVCTQKFHQIDINAVYVDFSIKHDVDKSCSNFKDKSKFAEVPRIINNKIRTELTWHNCITCPPKELYNSYLLITNGTRVVVGEYRKGYGFFVDEMPLSGNNCWWADIEQTIREDARFKGGN